MKYRVKFHVFTFIYFCCVLIAGSRSQSDAGVLHVSDLPVSHEDRYRQDKVPLPSAHVERDGALRMRLLGRRDEDDLRKGYAHLPFPSIHRSILLIIYILFNNNNNNTAFVTRHFSHWSSNSNAHINKNSNVKSITKK